MCISTLMIRALSLDFTYIFFSGAENTCLIKHSVNKVEAFDTKLFIPTQQVSYVCP